MVIGVAIFFVLAFVFDISFLHYFCLFFVVVFFYVGFILFFGKGVCLFNFSYWELVFGRRGGGVFLDSLFLFFLFWPLYIFFFTFSKKMFLFGFCLFILLFFI